MEKDNDTGKLVRDQLTLISYSNGETEVFYLVDEKQNKRIMLGGITKAFDDKLPDQNRAFIEFMLAFAKAIIEAHGGIGVMLSSHTGSMEEH